MAAADRADCVIGEHASDAWSHAGKLGSSDGGGSFADPTSDAGSVHSEPHLPAGAHGPSLLGAGSIASSMIAQARRRLRGAVTGELAGGFNVGQACLLCLLVQRLAVLLGAAGACRVPLRPEQAGADAGEIAGRA